MTQSWEHFVRTAAEFNDDLPVDEELDCMTISPHFFPPPKSLPPRIRKEDAFSKYYIRNIRGQSVLVPTHFIVRDHHTPPITHGSTWKKAAPHPCDVIVIAAQMTEHQMEYGWYLRYSSCPNELVRMSNTAIFDLFNHLETIEELNESVLKVKFIDQVINARHKIDPVWQPCRTQYDASGEEFHKCAFNVYLNYEASLCGDASHCRKRRRHPALKNIHKRSRSGTCTICLEDDTIIYDSKCCGQSGAMCEDCTRDFKCLCPICDRGLINAQYMCTGCGHVMAMRYYGFPCTTCNECTLCKDCYVGHVECGDCDDQRRANRRRPSPT